MKSDAAIQKDVMDQLMWDPFLRATEIGVAVKDGVVTLSGILGNCAQKLAAEKAAKKVSGVRAVAQDIQVGESPEYCLSDTEIARAVLSALAWHSAVPQETVQVKVEDGVVTLEGEVEWDYQRSSAKTAVSNLIGVRDVVNRICLRSAATPEDVRQKIAAALQRSAHIEASGIEVEVVGDTAVLRGLVRSLPEKEDAEEAAWSAPGITRVENHLEVEAAREYAL
ncbi:BON domain-containing protein [Paraflavisolibacter sp. H34]|uniref:BON domain-containing protein n=1 Tax=Huijunlia imazamoxiresistens TaxID=3127457 RepID=UPI003019EADE